MLSNASQKKFPSNNPFTNVNPLVGIVAIIFRVVPVIPTISMFRRTNYHSSYYLINQMKLKVLEFFPFPLFSCPSSCYMCRFFVQVINPSNLFGPGDKFV